MHSQRQVLASRVEHLSSLQHLRATSMHSSLTSTALWCSNLSKRRSGPRSSRCLCSRRVLDHLQLTKVD